jgi:hypothetical protein
MNPAIKKSAALTALIILLAVSVWIIVYFGNQLFQSQNQSSVSPVVDTESVKEEVRDLKDLVIESRIDLGVEPGALLNNPFALPATSTFAEDRSWILTDAYENVVASGTIPGLLSSYSAIFDVYWFNAIPKTEHGELRILEAGDSPTIVVPVKLPKETQTVEVYFRPAALSNCHSVTAVKRRIVATQNDLDYYEAALLELLKGPNQEESDSGLVTMISPQANLLRVGKNDQGRYVADFSSELKDQNQIECFWNIAQQQIQKTLSTVPLPGRTLEGTIFINGNTID